MAVERVASASVPDVTQTDSTDTAMPVALARRAEDDTGTQVPQTRAHCDALPLPAASTPQLRTNICTTSLLSVTDCSTVPGQGSVSYTRAGGQPAQRVSL
jgi:hypothetical protein